MLSIRLQRTGRKKLAQYKVIVQDSRYSPTSGKVVAYLGSYDPHNKTTTLDKEKAQNFLDNGAQPTNRVALLLQSEGLKLPKWVKIDSSKQGKLRNPEKLRKNQPEEEAPVEEPAEESTEKAAEEVQEESAPAEEKEA